VDPVVREVVAREDVVPVVVVLVVALLAVAPKLGDVDPVVLGSKSHQIQKNSRIDDRIGKSEKK
jgi:hypothetical protein